MPAGPATPLSIALPTQRLLPGAESVWAGRNAVEGYLDQLNRSSQVASRRIHHWDGRDAGAMGLSAVMFQRDPAATPLARVSELDAFMGEFRGSFGIEMIGGDLDAAPPVYMIGLPLAGAVTVTTRREASTARAGEGVIVDPAEVLESRLTPGMHFLEFCLPKSDVARLAGDWQAGLADHHPRFAPLLPAPLAQRLMFMAIQAADCLRTDNTRGANPMMFRRWVEMIALTLLDEQRIAGVPRTRVAGAHAPNVKPAIQRALDYIHAHADSDIGLADIGGAACMSVSSLLRHFNAQVGLSPYACLRTVRLDRARQELQADPAGLVRDIALRWGFQNASKFSVAYLARFGELPSATRSGGGAG